MLPLDDSRIIINLPRVHLGVALIMLQIGTFMHAGQTLTPDAAGRFRAGLRVGQRAVAFDSWSCDNPFQRRMQPGLSFPFLVARCRDGHARGCALRRCGRLAAVRSLLGRRIAPAAKTDVAAVICQRKRIDCFPFGSKVGADEASISTASDERQSSSSNPLFSSRLSQVSGPLNMSSSSL